MSKGRSPIGIYSSIDLPFSKGICYDLWLRVKSHFVPQFFPANEKIEIERAERPRVHNINRAMMQGAHREIYASIGSKGIVTAFNKTTAGATEERIRAEEIDEIEKQQVDELLRQTRR